MASASQARCIIRVDGEPRRLFSVTERRNGDLVVSLGGARFYRNFTVDTPLRDPDQIKRQKYSVHRSLESKTNINALKHTLELSDGRVVTTEHYTQAIKAHDRFAFMFAARSPHLGQDRYLVDKSERRIIDLGNYDPKHFVLYYAVFVGKPKHNFSTPSRSDDLGCSQMVFSYFRLIVLWSFAVMRSDRTGAKAHNFTIPPELIPENLKPAFEPTVKGQDENGCVALFRTQRDLLHSECLKLMLGRVKPDLGRKIFQLSRTIGYLRQGTRDSKAYKDTLMQLVRSGAISSQQ